MMLEQSLPKNCFDYTTHQDELRTITSLEDDHEDELRQVHVSKQQDRAAHGSQIFTYV